MLDHTVMEIEQLSALFLSMLRIYYVLYKNANTLKQFVSLLHNNTFLEIFWHQTFKAYQQIRHRFILVIKQVDCIYGQVVPTLLNHN